MLNEKKTHFERDWHFSRQKVENDTIKVNFVQTLQQSADILTKVLSKNKFAACRSRLCFKAVDEGLNILQLVDTGIQFSLCQLLEYDYIHADPHPGNLLATPDGLLAFLDFGMMSEAPESAEYAIKGHIIHLVNRICHSMARDYNDLDFLSRDVEFPSIVSVLQSFFDDVLGATVIPAYYALISRSLTVLERLALTPTQVLNFQRPLIHILLSDCSPIRIVACEMLWSNFFFRTESSGKFLHFYARSFHQLEPVFRIKQACSLCVTNCLESLTLRCFNPLWRCVFDKLFLPVVSSLLTMLTSLAIVLSSPKTCAFGGRVAGSWTRRLAARASQQLLRRHLRPQPYNFLSIMYLGRLECRVPKPFEEDQFFKNLYFALPIAVRTALRPMHTIQSARMNALTIFTGRSCVSSDTSDAATSLIQCSKNFR
uniref:ABC1 atypical kinase-like domain-containing protein n=1 Tax=Physcomitrium patens TaxID=3218 RepID=A0A2K1JI93_PHYPA|nr:hypothetical protein PHYPA_018685 [Physcomitrium patens]